MITVKQLAHPLLVVLLSWPALAGDPARSVRRLPAKVLAPEPGGPAATELIEGYYQWCAVSTAGRKSFAITTLPPAPAGCRSSRNG